MVSMFLPALFLLVSSRVPRIALIMTSLKVGIDLAPEMRGGEAKLTTKNMDTDDGKDDGNSREALFQRGKQESEGEQEIPGTTKGSSELRRRKGKNRDADAKRALVKASGESDTSTGERCPGTQRQLLSRFHRSTCKVAQA